MSHLPACHETNSMARVPTSQSPKSWQGEEDVSQSAWMDDEHGPSHRTYPFLLFCARREAMSLRANSRSAGVLTFRKDKN